MSLVIVIVAVAVVVDVVGCRRSEALRRKALAVL